MSVTDFIKWNRGLARKPEILEIAARLGRSRHEVAGLYMEFLEWCDLNVVPESESGDCPGFVRLRCASNTVVDSIIGADGFAEALTAVDWLIVRDGSLVIPRFGRHNGKSSKQRSLDAERKRTTRAESPAESGICPKSVRKNPDKSRTRLDKSRVEEKETPISPLAIDSGGFDSFWGMYPRKVGKQAAAKAYAVAVARFVAEKGIPPPEARAAILASVTAFAPSPKGQSGKFCPHPATWLNEGRYDDDPETWKGGPTHDGRSLRTALGTDYEPE